MTNTIFSSSLPPSESLTKREQEIMSLVATGRINKEIAAKLYISTETVNKHVQNILHKLGARNKIEALNKIQHYLISYLN